MFAPDERAVLREALRPEVDETLVHAVGTTFSLDLSATLAIPLAFAAQALSDSADPIAVLEAVRAASDRLDVFCQCGNIRAPRTPSDLAAFLEPMVHEVRAPQHQQGYLFHPKVWVARYESGGDERFRLICSTRNLTDSASWDAVIRLDGRPNGRRTDTRNRPLMDLVRALPELAVHQMEPERRERLNELADALGPVEWELPLSAGQASISFHALGLRRTRNLPEIIASLRGRRHLIVSPFIDDQAINEITRGSSNVILVSRADDLERLDPATLTGINTRIVSPLAGLAPADEDQRSDGDEHGLLGGLHAKLYVVEAANQAAVLIGSANATAAGLFGNNVEFMVELRGGRKALGIDNFLDPELGLGALLEEYPAQGGQQRSPTDELLRTLDRALRSIAGSTFQTQIEHDGTTYTQTTTVDPPVAAIDGITLGISPYGQSGRTLVMEPGQSSWSFTGLELTEVSAFLVITASAIDGTSNVQRSTLVRASLSGDPSSRRDAILAKQFSTVEQFLRFLALLLGIDQSLVAARPDDGSGMAPWRSLGSGSGLFELLVNAVAARPQALDDLSRLIERLQQTEHGRAVLPQGFEHLWAAISAAHQRLGARA